MSTELATVSNDELNSILAAHQPNGKTGLAEVTKAGDYLPYISLMSSNSKEVKSGEFPVGHFALRQGRTMKDLGKKVVMLLLDVRPKAMRFTPDVKSFFDSSDPAFQEIMEKADEKNSKMTFGPEFLVWLPGESLNCFATYYLGNKTGRNESPNLIARIENGTRICVQEAFLIESKDYSWHGPRTHPYDLDYSRPPREALVAELEKFANPKSDTPTEEDKDGLDR